MLPPEAIDEQGRRLYEVMWKPLLSRVLGRERPFFVKAHSVDEALEILRTQRPSLPSPRAVLPAGEMPSRLLLRGRAPRFLLRGMEVLE